MDQSGINLDSSGGKSQHGLVNQEMGELHWNGITLDQIGNEHSEFEDALPSSKFLVLQIEDKAPSSTNIPFQWPTEDVLDLESKSFKKSFP